MPRTIRLAACLVAVLLAGAARGGETITAVTTPAIDATNAYYVANRPPLTPSPLMRLPIGSIRPRGWLREQVRLEADGFIGHLTEISQFLKKPGNAWLSKSGEGTHGWEEVPYWLKGFGDVGYVLGDERILKETKFWIEAALATQREDGYFGPRGNLRSRRGGKGKPDLWPNMIMLNCLQHWHEHKADPRVLTLMTKYFRWELTIPEEDFLVPYWQQQRGADNLASVYWLYNRTGEKWLLDLAAKIFRHTANWTEGIPNWHNVNMSQAFRGPTEFWQQSRQEKHRIAAERNWQTIRKAYGQVPGGMFGGDENCRPGHIGPRQAVETCGMVEMMLSHEMLLAIDGQIKWADRCEDVAFNSLPAATTVDFKALRYLTAPNLVLSDAASKSPGVQNGGPMFLMDPHRHRCCQHNMGHGWPNYAESLWMATPDNGLAAVLYSDCVVTAEAGSGATVQIDQKTRYPFDGTIELKVHLVKGAKGGAAFPLYLRVPGWCESPKLQINGKARDLLARGGTYIRIERTWAEGDSVRLELPMAVAIRVWKANKDCLSVDRGPLTYSLKIGEKYVRHGGTDDWPAWEIHPTTPWNYGLLVDLSDPAKSFEFQQGTWPKNDRPWYFSAAPVAMQAKARRIAGWQLDRHGLVGPIQPSPVASDAPTETVTLIPMGAARLRVSAFPRIAAPGEHGHEWTVPPPLMADASHCFEGDTLEALRDGREPKNSNDHSIPRFTWWPRRGSTEWVQVRFKKPTEVARAAVYWFDDTGKGQCRVPAAWKLLYRQSKTAPWKPVQTKGPLGCEKDKYNAVTFEPVTATALRIEARLQPTFSGGILEWQVGQAR